MINFCQRLSPLYFPPSFFICSLIFLNGHLTLTFSRFLNHVSNISNNLGDGEKEEIQTTDEDIEMMTPNSFRRNQEPETSPGAAAASSPATSSPSGPSTSR